LASVGGTRDVAAGATYVAALALHGVGWGPAWEGWFSTFVDGWLCMLTDWAPAAV